MTRVLPPTIAEINLNAVKANVLEIRKLVGLKKKIMPIIKSNAYGYGAIPIARTLEPEVDAFGVAFAHEGIELREGGVQCPILVMGGIPNRYIKPALEYGLTLAVCDTHMACSISQIARLENIIAQIHIEVDTGMGRLGVPWQNAVQQVMRIYNLPNIKVEGIYTHFATSEIKDRSYTLLQLERFRNILKALDQKKITIPIKHLANSAAILQYPQTWFDMVRPGLIIYGIYPAKHLKGVIPLQFPLTIKSKIIQIRSFEKGESISYGRTFICPNRRRIGILQVGYTDGFSRVLSNRVKVLVKDKLAPVLGNICMDLCMIDITDIPEAEIDGDVILVGGENGASMVEELAALKGTIPYEILSSLGQRVKRVYQGENRFQQKINKLKIKNREQKDAQILALGTR